MDFSTLRSSGGSTDIYLIDLHQVLAAESGGIIPGSQARKTGLK